MAAFGLALEHFCKMECVQGEAEVVLELQRQAPSTQGATNPTTEDPSTHQGGACANPSPNSELDMEVAGFTNPDAEKSKFPRTKTAYDMSGMVDAIGTPPPNYTPPPPPPEHPVEGSRVRFEI